MGTTGVVDGTSRLPRRGIEIHNHAPHPTDHAPYRRPAAHWANSPVWTKLRDVLGTPDFVEHVLLLLEGMSLCQVNLDLAEHLHRWSVVEHDIDLKSDGAKRK